MTLKVHWIDGKREPQCAPDPKFPEGVDVDVSKGAGKTCQTPLPYPAPRCGSYIIRCDVCGLLNMVTTAGRPDDPRSFTVSCKLS